MEQQKKSIPVVPIVFVVIAAALVAHPKLLQRPIVIANGQARIGRPPENVEALLPS